MTHVIAEPCVNVKDKSCVDVCPVSCIYEFANEKMLTIHPTECIDCGACIPVCPVNAIFPADDVPDKWKSFTQENIEILKRNGRTDVG